jgi:drug/metabolite transporter (DMT)-like permease
LGSVGPELAFLALGGVLVSMICWNAGTRRIGVLNAMLMLNLVPVVVFAIRFAQGQRFEAIELVGAGLVIGALAANNLYLRRKAGRK